MQPCSQPWYGLIDWVNGMSGERLRVIAVRDTWIATVVRTWRDGSPIPGSGSWGRPSSIATRGASRNRLSGLNVAPRPRLGPGGGAGASGSVAIERLYAHLASRARRGVPAPLACAHPGRDQRRVQRDLRVQDLRDRAAGLGGVGDLGEL